MGALAAGNCVAVKPGSYAKKRLIGGQDTSKNLDNNFIKVIVDRHVTKNLLTFKFDYIFFTGSYKVGKIIAEAAAKQLIPLTLIRGKSPAIIDPQQI